MKLLFMREQNKSMFNIKRIFQAFFPPEIMRERLSIAKKVEKMIIKIENAYLMNAFT